MAKQEAASLLELAKSEHASSLAQVAELTVVREAREKELALVATENEALRSVRKPCAMWRVSPFCICDIWITVFTVCVTPTAIGGVLGCAARGARQGHHTGEPLGAAPQAG